MYKTCTRCLATKPLAEFYKNARTKDGKTAACGACIRENQATLYWAKPGHREAEVKRAVAKNRRRFEIDPAYRKAFRLWNHAYMRTTIPACMTIKDFVPICRELLDKGPGFVLDHVVPLKHPLVCGLHVPWNLQLLTQGENSKKAASFAVT
jgi:5-methylcytosine-specific restriction endonuclease McrA